MIPALSPVLGFKPTQISGCVLWLDAADSATITESGGAISQWTDKSTNAFALAQSTAGNKPTYQSAVQNGKNVVRFDGSNDYLFLSAAAFLNGVSGWTIFSVQKTTSNTAIQRSFTVSDSALYTTGNAMMNSCGITATNGFTTTGGRRTSADSFASVTDSTQISTAAFIATAVVGNYTTTTCTSYNNGTQAATSTSWLTSGNSNTGSGSIIVGNATNNGAPWAGDIAEQIVYNTALSATNQQRVEAYLKAKWGL